MNAIIFIIGILGFVLWGLALFAVFYKQLIVDRILSRTKNAYILVIFFMIALLPFSISTVAYVCEVEPYDLLYYPNSYGGDPDNPDMSIDEKIKHKEDIQKKVIESSEDPSLVSTVFFHFRGIGGQFSAGTPRGRAWAIWIGIIGTLLFSGLLIPSVLNITRKRSDEWLWGECRYNIQHSRYAVILGGHEAVPELIHQILDKNRENPIKYVIVQTTNNVYYYRQELSRELSQREEFHTILYNGGRGTLIDMKQLHVERAAEIYILGESAYRETEGDHDSQNMLALRNIATILKSKKRKQRVKCYTLFDYQATFAAFRYSDLSSTVREQIEFISLNINDLWSQNVLVTRQTSQQGEISYLPLEGDNRMNYESRKFVHLIVIGMNRPGLSLAKEATHICHYPNFETQGKRTRITFIDQSADKEMVTFWNEHEDLKHLCRHRLLDSGAADFEATPWTDGMESGPYAHWNQTPQVNGDNNWIDFEYQFVKGRLESESVQDFLRHAVAEQDAIVTVAVCLKQTQQAINAGIFLPREVFRSAIQVLVYQYHSSELLKNLSGFGNDPEAQAKMRYNKIRPFGMKTEIFAKDSVVDYSLAKLVNYVYNRPEDTKLEHINDLDNESGLTLQEAFWRQCTVADQMSSNYNANSIPTKLRYLGLDFNRSTLEEIEARINEPGMMEMLIHTEHNRWNTEKLLTGFRPLNAAEKAEFDQMLAEKRDYKEMKNLKKSLQRGWEMAHMNIISFPDLEIYDAPSIIYDEIMVRALPYIVLRWRNARR